MTLDEIQQEAGRLNPEEQRRLIEFLLSSDTQRGLLRLEEMSRRLDDQTPHSWISLPEAENLIKTNVV